ncbi:MAG: epoxyqueuosine reductase QueH [Peptococcaceae bacterium]|nr:epoxyqueuosine reductase QueH [Peptococcaceae bacterium]
MESLLLHICCAPCSIYPLKVLRQEFKVTGYFFNPNIHPYTEWKARRDCLDSYAKAIELEVVFDRGYLMEDFIRGAMKNESERCSFCYEVRLRSLAEFARDKGYGAVSSTLLVSPYQKHDLIRKIGEDISRELGIKFVYSDFRTGFREGEQLSKEIRMYRQKYCGCIFSEKERYCRTEIKEKNDILS